MLFIPPIQSTEERREEEDNMSSATPPTLDVPVICRVNNGYLLKGTNTIICEYDWILQRGSSGHCRFKELSSRQREFIRQIKDIPSSENLLD